MCILGWLAIISNDVKSFDPDAVTTVPAHPKLIPFLPRTSISQREENRRGSVGRLNGIAGQFHYT